MAKSSRSKSSAATKERESFDAAYPELDRAEKEAYAAIAERYREATDSLQTLMQTPLPRKDPDQKD